MQKQLRGTCLHSGKWKSDGRATAEDSDTKVGKTIRLIIQDKKCTRVNMWNIKLTFVHSCSQMRLQLLHFHAVFKMWPIFQELTSIVSFRRRHWNQSNFSENRNIQGNQSKDTLNEIRGLRRNIFLASWHCHCHPRLLKAPIHCSFTVSTRYWLNALLSEFEVDKEERERERGKTKRRRKFWEKHFSNNN